MERRFVTLGSAVTQPLPMAPRHWLDPLARRVLRLLDGPPPPGPTPWQIDVNRASRADWLRLPGCREDQVDLLQRLQQGGVQLSGPDDLAQLLDLPQGQLQRWRPHLLFRWYSEPPAPAPAPVDLNRAGAAALDGLGLFTPERRARLLRERARRPFGDLADLQHRLGLPPTVVEALIGRVVFGSGAAGPVLPRHRP
jgi:DNA uptake protein ComE-like DNA-binding protein